MLLMAAAPLTVSTAAEGERGYAVIRKAPWLLIPLAVGLVIAAQRQDIARHLKNQADVRGQGPSGERAGGRITVLYAAGRGRAEWHRRL